MVSWVHLVNWANRFEGEANNPFVVESILVWRVQFSTVKLCRTKIFRPVVLVIYFRELYFKIMCR